MQFQDYYKTLGVERTASQDEIRSAYRKLAKEWHPDRHPPAERAQVEQQFKAIAEAHEVLGDAEKRKRYDDLGANWQQGQDFQPPPGGGGFRNVDPEEFARMCGGAGLGGAGGRGGGFSDFFAQMFGDLFGPGGGPRPTPGRRRGADVEAELELPIGDAFRGGKRPFELQAALPCEACDGRGHVGRRACPRCGGLGHTRELRRVELTIPKDLYDGQVLRLRGLGQPGQAGGESGDLLLQMRLVADEVYRPRGSGDVEADLVLAPWEALDGTSVDVPVPSGTASVKVPPGTRAGERMRLRGQGLMRRGGGHGDLLLVVRMALPDQLTQEQQELLRQLGRGSAKVGGGVRQA
ncbi:MAG: J domain-containing protein [Planctomycetota bacterium]|nr:J domain-containing protein [Planctomycetota bacterium]